MDVADPAHLLGAEFLFSISHVTVFFFKAIEALRDAIACSRKRLGVKRIRQRGMREAPDEDFAAQGEIGERGFENLRFKAS